MPIPIAEKNFLVDTLSARLLFISLHYADPGSTGANEISGITRQSVTWSAASGGVASPTAAVVFNIPANAGSPYNITHWSAWSASSGGVLRRTGSLLTPRQVPTGGASILTFPVGTLTIDMNLGPTA